MSLRPLMLPYVAYALFGVADLAYVSICRLFAVGFYRATGVGSSDLMRHILFDLKRIIIVLIKMAFS